MDAALPDLFMKSLAGSYREGAIRCLLDLAETLPDQPVGMYDVARGQCHSLSEDHGDAEAMMNSPLRVGILG